VFVFYDDVQYTKNDWRNRNQIKTSAGPRWLTIPVGKDEKRLINQVPLPQDMSWSRSHWNEIRSNYLSSEFFSKYSPWLNDLLLNPGRRTLSEWNQSIIQTIASEFLGIRTVFVRSEDYALSGQKQNRLLSLLSAIGATTYVSGPAARAYLQPDRFAESNITLEWKDYAGYPEYPQPNPPFIHAVSVLDLLFCTGPKAPYYIWGWRSAGSSGVISQADGI
jgi:hypothetical protein